MTARDKGSKHYTAMDVQPWDVVDTWPLEQRIGYYRGNAIKYLMRVGSKDAPLQEIEKAAHYCEKLAETLRKSQCDASDTPLEDGWCKWDGGSLPPVPDHMHVRIRFRDGLASARPMVSRFLDWEHAAIGSGMEGSDIVAYKVANA